MTERVSEEESVVNEPASRRPRGYFSQIAQAIKIGQGVKVKTIQEAKTLSQAIRNIYRNRSASYRKVDDGFFVERTQNERDAGDNTTFKVVDVFLLTIAQLRADLAAAEERYHDQRIEFDKLFDEALVLERKAFYQGWIKCPSNTKPGDGEAAWEEYKNSLK